MAQGLRAGEERFAGAGGLNIFFRWWRPEEPRAVVVVVHGFNSHSGYYRWVAEQFAASGVAVYALDLRGRGHSDGERFYVDRFSDWVGDVATIHSMGYEDLYEGSNATFTPRCRPRWACP